MYCRCKKKRTSAIKSLNNVTKGSSYRPETFMSILRKYLIENLRKTYNHVSYTYGYETKSKRIANRLEKDHNVDARCISGNFSAEPDGIYLYKKVRCHNRQIHKFKTLKGGIRKLNQAPYMIMDQTV